MKKAAIGVLIWCPLLGSLAVGDTYYATDHLLSAPAAGKVGTTAIHRASNAIVAWADGYTNVQYGTDVAAEWMTPEKALGPAAGTSFEVVSLARPGSGLHIEHSGKKSRISFSVFCKFKRAEGLFCPLVWK